MAVSTNTTRAMRAVLAMTASGLNGATRAAGDSIHCGTFNLTPSGVVTVIELLAVLALLTTSSSRPLIGWNG